MSKIVKLGTEILLATQKAQVAVKAAKVGTSVVVEATKGLTNAQKVVAITDTMIGNNRLLGLREGREKIENLSIEPDKEQPINGQKVLAENIEPPKTSTILSVADSLLRNTILTQTASAMTIQNNITVETEPELELEEVLIRIRQELGQAYPELIQQFPSVETIEEISLDLLSDLYDISPSLCRDLFIAIFETNPETAKNLIGPMNPQISGYLLMMIYERKPIIVQKMLINLYQSASVTTNYPTGLNVEADSLIGPQGATALLSQIYWVSPKTAADLLMQISQSQNPTFHKIAIDLLRMIFEYAQEGHRMAGNLVATIFQNQPKKDMVAENLLVEAYQQFPESTRDLLLAVFQTDSLSAKKLIESLSKRKNTFPEAIRLMTASYQLHEEDPKPVRDLIISMADSNSGLTNKLVKGMYKDNPEGVTKIVDEIGNRKLKKKLAKTLRN